MKIAICSDIHDNIWALSRALPLMQGAGALICCGDFCAPFTLVQLAEGFNGPMTYTYRYPNSRRRWSSTEVAVWVGSGSWAYPELAPIAAYAAR